MHAIGLHAALFQILEEGLHRLSGLGMREDGQGRHRSVGHDQLRSLPYVQDIDGRVQPLRDGGRVLERGGRAGREIDRYQDASG